MVKATPDIVSHYDKLVSAWIESKDAEKQRNILLKFMDTPEYAAIDYFQKNRRFVTSTKLKAFAECQLFAKYEYVDGIKTEYDDNEAFVIGIAFDNLKTHGKSFFESVYQVLAPREKRTDEGDRIQLTNGQGATITQMDVESSLHPLFPINPAKENLIWLAFGKIPCKAEIDCTERRDGTKIIGDFKTCRSLTTFEPMRYTLQMGMYYGAYLETRMEKREADLFVVDKHDWARSHVWTLTIPTLEQEQGRVNELISLWAESEETGIFEPPTLLNPDGSPNMDGLKKLWDSKYYSICPYARTAPATRI